MKEKQRLQKLAGINEIKINNPSTMTNPNKDVIAHAKELTQFFGEGSSPEEYEPLEETYYADEYFDEDNYDQDDEQVISLKYLLQNYSNKIFFFKNLLGYPDNDSPKNTFESYMEIGEDYITVKTNYLDEYSDGKGWFTTDKAFHPNPN